MGSYFGIKVEEGESHLLAIAKLAVMAPVLLPWEELEDADGNPYFYNHRTRVTTRRHPLDQAFLALVQRLRAEPLPDSEGRCWMQFHRESGEAYFYNFADSSEAPECPDGGLIVDVPDDLVPRYTAEIMMGSRERKPTFDSDEAIRALNVLSFKSWWLEDKEEETLGNGQSAGGGLKKQYVTVNFLIDTQTFEVHMENDQEISLYNLTSVTAKHGMPVQCWDLHVGCKLNLLGKSTTMMQGSLATVEWLEYHARRLVAVKAKLEKELAKYTTVSLPASVTFKKGANTRGGTSLRALLDQIDELRGMLARYRPSVAAKSVKPLETLAVPIATS